MKPSLRTLLACLIAVAALSPLARSDHGRHAVYQAYDAALDCHVTVDGTYLSGDGDDQAWQFVVVIERLEGACLTQLDGAVCSAFGSVEAGFGGSCLPGWDFIVRGTNHPHACCDHTAIDFHTDILVDLRSTLTGASYYGYGGVVVVG